MIIIKPFQQFTKGLLNESEIIDISDESTFPVRNLKSNEYFVIHHTAGLGSAHDVVNILNKRDLSVQWIVDTEGRIHRGLPPNSLAYHAGRNASDDLMPDVKNSNSQGVEVIGRDDADIKNRFDRDIAQFGYPRQAEAVRRIIKYLGYEKENIVGHGEITKTKEPTEGKTIKDYVLANWDKPVDLSGLQGPDRKADYSLKNSTPLAREPEILQSNQRDSTPTIDSSFVTSLIKKLKERSFSLDDFNKSSKTEPVSNSPISAVASEEDEDFYKAVLAGIGATVTPEKMKFLKAWRQAEGGKANYNPFNTTKSAPGATDYNSVGVKEYPDRQTGLEATINTLKLSYYKDLVSRLLNDSSSAEQIASSPDLKTWGTGSGVERVLAGRTINPPPIAVA